MIAKKIFVYNCYNLDGNNTTLNVIKGVWTERDVFLCAAEMVLGHLIPKVVTSLLHPLPFLIKSSSRLISHCGRDYGDKSSREANKHLHPVSTYATSAKCHLHQGFIGQCHERQVTVQDDFVVIWNFYQFLQANTRNRGECYVICGVPRFYQAAFLGKRWKSSLFAKFKMS